MQSSKPSQAKRSNNVYLRFLALAHAVTANLENDALDATAMRLLDTIAVAVAQNNALTVTQAMQLSNIASPATIHRKLDALYENELIKHVFRDKNRRTKYLITTAKAEKHFIDLGNALVQAQAR